MTMYCILQLIMQYEVVFVSVSLRKSLVHLDLHCGTEYAMYHRAGRSVQSGYYPICSLTTDTGRYDDGSSRSH